MKTLETILKEELKDHSKADGEKLAVTFYYGDDYKNQDALIWKKGRSVFYMVRPGDGDMYLSAKKVKENSASLARGAATVPVWPAKNEQFWRDFPEFMNDTVEVDLSEWMKSK